MDQEAENAQPLAPPREGPVILERRAPAKFGVGVRVRVTDGTCTGWVGRIGRVEFSATLGSYIYDLTFEPSSHPARFFFERELEAAQ